MMAVPLNNVVNGAVSRGPCQQASSGGVYEKCEMDCDFDGGCYETVSTETCDCNGNGVFYYTTYNYQVRKACA